MNENQKPAPSYPVGPVPLLLHKVSLPPFWSVMIPTYNRATFLERTLASVLSQDPGTGEMQIQVVDDASTVDDPEPVVRRVGGDRVSFIRQPRRLGLVGNWNSCIARAVGEWIHILHSDDVVFPGFYACLKASLAAQSEIGAAFCRWVLIDEDDHVFETSELERTTPGILTNFIETIGASQRIQCASIVVRRSAYERIGGFLPELGNAADWEMWKRIAANFPIWYEPKILAAWRCHQNMASEAWWTSGENVADIRRCIEVSRSLLPPGRGRTISRRAKDWIAVAAFRAVRDAIGQHEFTMARNQFREGLKSGVSLAWGWALFLLPARLAYDGMRRAYRRLRKSPKALS